MAIITQNEKLMFPLPHNPLIPLQGSPIYFQGADLHNGVQPAVLFFALSAQTSLFEDPFNQPVLRLIQQGIRVFSWDLPFHGAGQDPHKAMHHWAQEFVHRSTFISDFLDLCQANLDYLIEQGLIDVRYLAVAGLSRGGFIATHLAARDSRIKIVLGFAPLTQLKSLEELKSFAPMSFEEMELNSLVAHLIHTPLRFYIGNHDMRVGTDACYSFIHTLTEAAFNQGVRSPRVELMIYPSIGHKGHGTPRDIFRDGADWIKKMFANL
jgi:esterase FrsA